MTRMLLVVVATLTAAAMGNAAPAVTLAPVYHPRRLEVMQPMVTREGVVMTDPVHHADGDATFEFQVAGTHEVLHVEITCV